MSVLQFQRELPCLKDFIRYQVRCTVFHFTHPGLALPLKDFTFSQLANNSARLVELLGLQLYHSGGIETLRQYAADTVNGMNFRI